MASSWRGEKQTDNKENDRKKQTNKQKLQSVSVQRWPVFSSCRLHIQLENKIQTRVPPHRGISSSLVPCPWAGKTRNEAGTSRSLHLCSPLRRGMRAPLGNRKPNRATVKRIQIGRFSPWSLNNCKETEEKTKLLASKRLAASNLRVLKRN